MLESKIDDLYRKPLNEFIPARSALASEHKGDDGRRIKALKKPTLVPWAVNQVYWHARPIFDRVQASGADLRRAQIAALEGRKADVQAAAAAHRKAIGSAVERAMALARASEMNPDRDAVARTFEALSIASEPPEPPGRLTQPLQPGGFELLAGVEPMARAPEGEAPTTGAPDAPSSRSRPLKGVPSTRRVKEGLATVPPKSAKPAIDARAAAERAAADRARERARAAAARRQDAAIARLERDVARAKQQVARTRLAWDRATDQLTAAERRLSETRRPRPVV
jgi:hypothetical protein